MRRSYVYKAFERFWHWAQAILIMFLAFSGFEIHGSVSFFGFENAVKYHNIAAYAFLILIAFAIFWHLTTGEWRQYIPTYKNIKAQLDYYLFGIFKNAPHPVKKTVLSKLNPLQKLTYFCLKILVIPVIVTSGLLYMFYRYPQKYGVEALNIHSLEIVALVHTAAAFILAAFIITHLYLITTGRTITSNLKAMLTGYEDLEEENGKAEEEKIVEEVTEEISSI
ncbi:MAG TPA: cytochrome b/b6 domain-containing protein [Ignavibacteriales bacterium]|nr:cytochrome b/b6 domain-containing protein [Ignavibacteriales bacterium]